MGKFGSVAASLPWWAWPLLFVVVLFVIATFIVGVDTLIDRLA